MHTLIILTQLILTVNLICRDSGGGVLALISTSLPCKRLRSGRTYKCFESIMIKVTICRTEWVIIGMYRPPKPLSANYQLLLEEELSHICNWASVQAPSVTVIGDLNLDRLRPQRSEGKLLLDLEAEQGFECLFFIYLNIFWKTFAPRANKLIKGAYAYLQVVFN
jgi:hypothetical protein